MLQNLDKIKDGPTRNRIKKLHPLIRQDVIDAILEINEGGVNIRITYGLRTFAEQDKLYAKGRTIKGSKVTNAKGGQSYHNYGLAIDFCLLHKDGKVSWSMHEDLDKDGKKDWKEVVDAFKKRGFEWGGEWTTFKDNPHLQKIFGSHWKNMLKLYNAKKVDSEGYIIFKP